MNLHEQKEFEVNTSSLKLVRSFAKDFFEKYDLLKSHKDDLVLAISEAAQNIVKHAYNGGPHTDKMKVEISLKENFLQVDLYDKRKVAIPKNIKPRELNDIRSGGLGTFFIREIMDEVVFKSKNEKIKYMDEAVFKTKKDKNWINHLVLTKRL